MKPTEVTTVLEAMFKGNCPVLIIGPPGMGKSDIVEQATKAAGADLILSHPAVADPTDAKGLPWPGKDGKTATFLPFGELARAIEAKKPTVWFLDDLGQAPPSVQASFMQLLLARRVNDHTISDEVTFVAATNRRTDRAGVSGILEPVKSRFTTIIELEPDLDDWCQWAFGNDIPVELIAFLRFRPELLCKFEASADLTNSPVPRTWAAVGKMMKMDLPRAVQQAAFAGAVGAGASLEFLSFLRLYRDLPSIDGILIDPNSAIVPTEPAAMYAVVTALAAKANQANFDRIAEYATRVVDAGRAEFAALLFRDSVARHPEVQHTKGFVQLVSSELGQLMSGEVR